MDTDTHTRTRIALHTVAEHLLAADLHRYTSRIGLRTTDGGFGQPEYFLNGERRRIRVDGASLVVLEGDTETWTPLSTLGAAAEAADAEAGAPSDVFTPETSLDPEAPLDVDAGAARRLADWFDLVGTALEELRRDSSDREPGIVQLWPEHFDLAFSTAEINFGGSPGDAGSAEPYLYVGPWEPRTGEFWNEPFGASLAHSEIDGPDDALAFFSEGLRAATHT